MKKIILLLISLAVATPVLAQENNWEVSPFTQENNQPNSQLQENQTKSKHNISVEYGFGNFTDFIWAIGSSLSFGSKNDKFPTFIPGDIGINYGCEVSDVFETGVIFNFAIPDGETPFFTLMPRAKLGPHEGFVRPFMELDLGILVLPNDEYPVIPMLHGTLLGLEIGYFYMQILGWGQRGLFYAGVKIPL